MQSCSLCGSGPFKKGDFKQHELTQKHLKAFKAQQEQASSSLYACAVCAGSSFASKQNYEQHCLSQKHLKALAAQQEQAAACKEREGHIAASIAQNVAPSKKKQRCSKASEEVDKHVKEVLPKKSSPEEAFDESRNAAMDAGLQKAAAFFSVPNIPRAKRWSKQNRNIWWVS